MPPHHRRLGAAIFILTGIVFVGLSLAMVFDVLGLQIASPTAEKQAIQKVLDDQATAWNQGDLDGFMAGYWPSAELVFFSGNNKTQGWQQTKDRFQKRYQSEGKEMGKLSFGELEIDLVGARTAWVRGRFHLATSKGPDSGLFTLVLRKQKDGWRIVHDHTTVDPPG